MQLRIAATSRGAAWSKSPNCACAARALFERPLEEGGYDTAARLRTSRGEFMTIYPVPGNNNEIRRGYRRSNLVWYHPIDEAGLADLCTDASAFVTVRSCPRISSTPTSCDA